MSKKQTATKADLLKEIEQLKELVEFQKVALEQGGQLIGEFAESHIQGKYGGAVGIALRTAETKESFRMLLTIRAGFSPEKIQFNFGSGGITTQGGGDGGQPPCP